MERRKSFAKEWAGWTRDKADYFPNLSPPFYVSLIKKKHKSLMSTKELYWKYSLIAIIIGLGIVIFKQIAPFIGGLLGALTIYILVRKQMMYLSDKRKMKRGIAAILITAEAILCFLVPLALVVWLTVINLQNINLNPQAIIAPLEETASIIQAKTGYYILGKDTAAYALSILPRIGQAVMGGISSFVVNIFVLVFVLYFMLIGGKRMEQYVNDLLPFNAANTQNVVSEINMIVRSNAIGIPLLAIIQGGVAMIGYWIFGAPNVLFAGFLTSFASMIPVVGTALVWIPTAVYMALTGNWLQAIGLAIYGCAVISQLDNLIRFIIQKKMADIHPLITVFGVIIGLSIFGFMGIIFGPLLLSLFFLFVNMFKKEYLEKKTPYIKPPQAVHKSPFRG